MKYKIPLAVAFLSISAFILYWIALYLDGGAGENFGIHFLFLGLALLFLISLYVFVTIVALNEGKGRSVPEWAKRTRKRIWIYFTRPAIILIAFVTIFGIVFEIFVG